MASDRVQRQIDRLLDEAEEAITSQDWTTVGNRARSVLRLDPGNQDALSYLAAAERDLPTVTQSVPETETDASRASLEQYIPRELLAKLEGARTKGAVSGERRVVTMLFCDVIGSTSLAERLDPEEWTEIMNGAFEYLIAPVYRYEGTLARLMGDAILAFFGAPIAHEDDPQRAVLAGLHIVQGIRAYQEEVKRKWNLDFGVRVGINTGLVVVGEVGSDLRVEYTAMGDAINLAARMEQTAQTGTVQISADTYNLIAPLFEFENLEEIEVKGKSEPVSAYRVIRPKAVPGRLRGIEGLNAPLVGRDSEISVLRQVLERLHDGRGGIVCLMGEAGIGKTSLLDELHADWEKIASSEAPWIVSHGVSYDTTRPYGLFMQRMLQIFGIADNDSIELVREKIAIPPEGFPPEVQTTVVRALEALLDFGTDADSPQLQGEAVKHKVYEAYHSMWRAAASSAPTVIVLDDLHWADAASVDLLIDMFSLVDEVPLLLLCSFRPERQSPAWRVKQTAETDYPHLYTEISLGALSDEDSALLFGILLNVSDSPPQVRQMILAKTGGNPLFLEEFIRTLVDTGAITHDESGMHWRADTKVEDIPIPENLQALLTARIDRLEQDARRTLQLSSVIGRSFHHGVLKLISDPSIALDRQLSTLQRAELIREAARVPELEYIFQHDLTREAAYNSILLRERQEFHKRVGEAIEEIFYDRLEEQSHLMAHHFYQAGDTQRTLKYSVIAGERALSTYAHEEALTHFQIGLTIKEGQPMDAETAALCFGLGVAQAATLETHQIQDAVASLARAFDYYVEVGEVERAVAVAEHPFKLSPGQTRGADRFITRALALVPPDSHEAGRLLCRYVNVLVIENGEYEAAQGVFSRALNIARREQDEALEMRILASASEPDVQYLRLQGGLVKSLRAIELAQQADDPRTEVNARYFAGMAQLIMADLEGTRQGAVAILAPAERLRDHYMLAGAYYLNQIASSLGGNWQSSRDFNDRGLAVSPMDPRLLFSRAMLEAEVGEIEHAYAYLERFLEAMRLSAPGPTLVNSWTALLIPSVARITGRMDQLDLAEKAADAVLSSPAVTPIVTMISRCGLAMLAVLRSDIASAEEQYAALESARGIGIPASFMRTVRAVPGSFTPTARLLALLAQTMGDLDRAMDHFEDSLTLCRRADFRPDLAWTCSDYSDALLQRNGTGDRTKAMALLDESLAISRELGMRPLIERVRSRRDILTA